MLHRFRRFLFSFLVALVHLLSRWPRLQSFFRRIHRQITQLHQRRPFVHALQICRLGQQRRGFGVASASSDEALESPRLTATRLWSCLILLPPSASTSNSPSACSSASLFSRSCLSQSTASSSSSSSRNAESASSEKRSVRFYPLSVIFGDDSHPCGHKFLYERNDSKPVRSVKSKLTKLLNVGRSNPWYLRDKENKLGGNGEREMIGGGEGDGDDTESYASSDLFEQRI